MSIIQRSGDLVWTFRLINLVTTNWDQWDAFKLGIIDKNGKRIKSEKLNTRDKKDAYSPFIRVAANIKRLVGKNRVSSVAASLFLLKEHYGLSDDHCQQIATATNLSEPLSESQWYVLSNGKLTPGSYRLQHDLLVSEGCLDIIYGGDVVYVQEGTTPTSSVLGIDIYEVTHVLTGHTVYVTAQDLLR